MTQEDKKLLLIDLCARLPYNVICSDWRYDNNGNVIKTTHIIEHINLSTGYCKYKDISIESRHISEIKPYLRPLSSMIKEEKNELNNILEFQYYSDDSHMCESNDWLNAHHFDYRGLIEKDLALEAPEGMYKTE